MDKTQQLMVFAIDDKLRTITMPNNGSVFGVSGDIEVNQVEFQMPRYCAGFDMTDFIGRVNYVNPNGDSNYYESEISGTDDTVSFIWLMKPDVTRYSGDVKFSVKLYKKQDGKILKQFNTRSAVGRVLEGFDVIDSVTPEEQETLLHKIEAEIKEEVKAYIDQYAEDKVSEMTQGLPEAVNSLKEDLDEMSDSLLKVVKTVKSSNLFDASADYDDGLLSSDYTIIKEGYSSLATTGYIKINRCKHITLTRMKTDKERMFETIVAVGMYDINKQPINYFRNSKNLDCIDIIDKAYYVRVTINKEFCFTKPSIYKPMLSCSTEVTEYEPYFGQYKEILKN